MSKRTCLPADQKDAIIWEHLLERSPVSDLCDKHGISTVNFYNWQRQLFENGAICFGRKKNAAKYHVEETGEAALLRQILGCFRDGDVAVTDRFYGN